MSRRRPSARAVGIALGFLLDTAVGDPRRGHPVAAFGSVFSAVERRFCADSRARGVACTAAAVSSVAAIGWLGERMTRRSAGAKAGLVALATWACLGGTSLSREAFVMTDHLQRGDVPAARHQLAHLCSRDATDLDEAQLVRAAVESVAENTSDAVVAPLLWAAVGGAPGVLVHRAVNTLDAMVGYRTPRHLRFGWAAARLDDLLGLAPARLTAGLTVALAPLVGGAPAAALLAWRRDAPAHPSPNAGPVEAAFAGALGVRLGGTSTYAGHVEDRGTLGNGRPVVLGDLGRAVTLSRAVAAAALIVAVVVARAAGGRRG